MPRHCSIHNTGIIAFLHYHNRDNTVFARHHQYHLIYRWSLPVNYNRGHARLCHAWVINSSLMGHAFIIRLVNCARCQYYLHVTGDYYLFPHIYVGHYRHYLRQRHAGFASFTLGWMGRLGHAVLSFLLFAAIHILHVTSPCLSSLDTIRHFTMPSYYHRL